MECWDSRMLYVIIFEIKIRLMRRKCFRKARFFVFIETSQSLEGSFSSSFNGSWRSLEGSSSFNEESSISSLSLISFEREM